MGAALTLTEEDRALLVLLPPAQAGRVVQALLGGACDLSEREQGVFDAIAGRREKRKKGAARWRRWQEKRLTGGLPNRLPNASPPPPAAGKTEYAPAFETFWRAYPKKVGKQAAWSAFQRVTVPVEQLVAAVERQKRSAQWKEQGGRFIPHPTTWLNQGRWEDEVVPGCGGARQGGWNTSNPFLELLEEERGT